MKDGNNIQKNKRKIKQKEAYEKMKQMGLEGIVDEISKIDALEGISFVTALLLNELIEGWIIEN